MGKVLVTGAGGFIGSHLAADLMGRGHEVVAMDVTVDRIRHLRSSRFEVVEGDIGEPDLVGRMVEGVDTVFHLAGAHLSVRLPESEYYRINVEASRTLAETAARAGVGRFVHCSSTGVFGQIESPPASEDTPCHPRGEYERTKLLGEREVMAVHHDRGLPVVILRPGWVYGPGCPRTEKLFRRIAEGRFVVAGRGDRLRHCLYIRDMLTAFHLAAGSDAAIGHVIVVGDERAVQIRELIGEIARLTGSRPPLSVPRFALYAAGLAAEMGFRPFQQDPPISRRTLKFFTSNSSFDIERARRLLGFQPRYDVYSGLRETHSALRESVFWSVPLSRLACA